MPSSSATDPIAAAFRELEDEIAAQLTYDERRFVEAVDVVAAHLDLFNDRHQRFDALGALEALLLVNAAAGRALALAAFVELEEPTKAKAGQLVEFGRQAVRARESFEHRFMRLVVP